MPNPTTFTHAIAATFSRPGENLGGTQTVQGPSENCADFTIGAAADDEVHVFTCSHAKKLSLFVVADADMTVCGNDDHDGSPSFTLALKADVPVTWVLASSSLGDDPFGTADTTSLHVTSTDGGTLKIRELENNI